MKKINFDGLMINLASPEEILKRSHGSIELADTVNYRTGKPRLKGLFCEATFGPVKPYECSCGRYKWVRYKWFICERCGVEITTPRVRRERMWHIELASPVVHVRYYKTSPSRIWLLLDLANTEIEKILYFVKYITINEIDDKKKESAIESLTANYQQKLEELDRVYQEERADSQDRSHLTDLDNIYKENKVELDKEYVRMKSIINSLKKGSTILESDYRNFLYKFNSIFWFKSWSEAIHDLLTAIDLQKSINETSEKYKISKWENKKKLFKLLKLLINLYISGTRPEYMIIKYLPVIPPDIRPVITLNGGKIATSDANQYYRRVIQRNLRLKKMIQVGMPDIVKKNEIRLLQESVNNLLVWDKTSWSSDRSWFNRVFKSLTDKLSKKEGIFRQNLLGKRVDYSGRSVITVWPNLKLDECGVPLYIAIRIFSPFVIAKLIEEWYAHTPRQAEKLIKDEDPIALNILQDVIKDKYVLLNRPPTLHRLSIQAFKIKLMPGKTIRIHPLVCAWFNADFDGDQMAVHLPISEQAQQEAKDIMSSIKNTLKPASWAPVIELTQDMVLWVYYLTNYRHEDDDRISWFFNNIEDIINKYNRGSIDIYDQVVLKYNEETITTTVWRVVFNSLLPENIRFTNNDKINTIWLIWKRDIKNIMDVIYDIWWQGMLVEVADNFKNYWFKFATESTVSTSLFDMLTPEKKDQLIREWEDKIQHLQNSWYHGFYSYSEKSKLTQNIRLSINEEIQKLVKTLYQENKHNSLYMLVNSGARWSFSTLSFLNGMRWLLQWASGKVIDLPIKSSYREWYTPLEYFLWCHNSRKWRTDIALKTADSWYITRKLCDSTQENIVREDDCGTSDYIIFNKYELEANNENFYKVIYWRILAQDLQDNNGIQISPSGTMIDKNILDIIEKSEIDQVSVRSPLVCHTVSGVCQKCFGMDLATRSIIDLGVAIGIVASQSLWEPTTQLTLNSKHNKSFVGADADITLWGLERVNELLEVRTPKIRWIISPFDGSIRVTQEWKLQAIEIIAEEERKNYYLKDWYTIIVKKWDILSKWGDFAVKGRSKMKVKEQGMVLEIAKDHIVLWVYKSEKRVLSPGTSLKVKNNEKVIKWQILTSWALDLNEYKEIMSDVDVQRYIVNELQKVYTWASQDVNRKYMEIVIKQLFSKVLINDCGDSSFVPWSEVIYEEYLKVCTQLISEWKLPPKWNRLINSLTQVAKKSASRLSAASFQETVRVMVENGLKWAIDELTDLKSNVILGRPLPIWSNYKKMIWLEEEEDAIEEDVISLDVL